MEKKIKQASKFMSLVLRHKPEQIGLELDENGWANVPELIKKMNAALISVDFEMMKMIVATNDKKRFAFNEDETKIRASQGHSITVDVELKAALPPGILYHGTATRFAESIMKAGLSKQQRQHVHLSSLKETAVNVGSRHGKPMVLEVDAKGMAEAGFVFYLSENGVWLTDHVPVAYLAMPGL